jgi:hypothetical protein
MRHLLAVLAVVLFAGAAVPATAQSYDRGQSLQLAQAAPFDRDRRGRRAEIDVLSAWYGVEGRACDATRQVSRACNGRNDCTVRATNRLCGDPVPGVVKVLTVWYECERRRGPDSRPRTITRSEGSFLGLNCPGGRR